jgi:multiple sugar transport system permease protein
MGKVVAPPLPHHAVKVAPRARRPRFGPVDVLAWSILGAALIMAVLPFLWTLLNSFKLGRDIATVPPKVVFQPILDNYTTVFSINVHELLLTTAIVTVGTVTTAITIGSLGGYALARYRHGVFKLLGLWVFSERFLPTIVFILPLFIMFTELGLTGTRFGLVLAYQLFALPVTIWLTWGFFSQVPYELEEAAMMDGCNRLQAFLKVALPVALPGIGAAAVVTTIFSWNQFLVPFILGGRHAQVITTQVARYVGGEDVAAYWGELSALAVIIVAPVILLGFALNRTLLRGLLGRH